jgi:hypothetical protein
MEPVLAVCRKTMTDAETDGGGRRRRPHALAEAIGRVTSPLYQSRGFAGGAVIGDWANIVGDRLAAESAPESLRFPPKRRRGGTLTLRIASGGLALELQHLQGQLIERINSYFGFDAVARIRFVHGPITSPAARREAHRPPVPASDPNLATPADLLALLAKVDDPDLRAALESLGKAVFSANGPMSAKPAAAPSAAGDAKD